MHPSRSTVAGIGALLIIGVGGMAGWRFLSIADGPVKGQGGVSSPSFVEANNRTGGVAVYLMPVPAEAITDREPGEDVWDGLLNEIVVDADSQGLFRRLYGNVAVNLLIDAESHDNLTASPDSEFPVVVSVRLTREEDRHSKRQGHVYGILDVNRKSRLASRSQVTSGPVDSIVSDVVKSAMASDPEDVPILFMVVNDYLLRKHASWQLFGHGYSADDIELPTGGPDDFRSELDRKVRDYVERHFGDDRLRN